VAAGPPTARHREGTGSDGRGSDSQQAVPASSPPLIAVAAGRSDLHDGRSKRRWSVDVAPFLLGTTPVTQAEYSAVTGQRPSTSTGDDKPVETVSWLQAVRFCNQLSSQTGLRPAYKLQDAGEEVEWDREADGYRLPTEAEWEYACRAGSTGPRYGPLAEIAWTAANSGGGPRSVGRQQPNPWGFHDMLGLVWEWCWDLYDPEVYGAYRVLRGGGWADAHWSCRAGVRRRSHPTFAIDDVGFRVARSG
jgi:formylglycine-generating enzyme